MHDDNPNKDYAQRVQAQLDEKNEVLVSDDTEAHTKLMVLKDWVPAAVMGGVRLIGKVFGNPRFRDGDVVRTSSVQYYYAVAVTKSGSHYVLNRSRVAYEDIGLE